MAESNIQDTRQSYNESIVSVNQRYWAVKPTTKWDTQLVESNIQTRTNATASNKTSNTEEDPGRVL